MFEGKTIPKWCAFVTLPRARQLGYGHLALSWADEAHEKGLAPRRVNNKNSIEKANPIPFMQVGAFGKCIDAVLFWRNGGMRSFWFWVMGPGKSVFLAESLNLE